MPDALHLALTGAQWAWVMAAAFMIGFSKTGINGVSMLVIPIMAAVFGGRDSTGMVLPMLIAGDLFAVVFYRRHAEWRTIRALLPWALAGILIGGGVGALIDDRQFKMLIAIIVLVCVGLLVWQEKRGEIHVTSKPWFAALTGAASGFASMIGNAAGPIFSVFLLAKGLKKNDFIGTLAWFFMIVNFCKLPFQIFAWHNITASGALLALLCVPAVAAGAFLGIAVIRRINEKVFRWLIIGMTALASIRLFF